MVALRRDVKDDQERAEWVGFQTVSAQRRVYRKARSVLYRKVQWHMTVGCSPPGNTPECLTRYSCSWPTSRSTWPTEKLWHWQATNQFSCFWDFSFSTHRPTPVRWTSYHHEVRLWRSWRCSWCDSSYSNSVLFNTNNIEIVKACQEFFSFELPSEQLAKRVVKFESKVKSVTV